MGLQGSSIVKRVPKAKKMRAPNLLQPLDQGCPLYSSGRVLPHPPLSILRRNGKKPFRHSSFDAMDQLDLD